MCGIYIGCGVLAVVVIAALLDNITLEREQGRQRKFSFHLVFETLRHLKNSHYQQLLVVLTMYSGIEQAFMTGDYTKVSMLVCLRAIWCPPSASTLLFTFVF